MATNEPPVTGANGQNTASAAMSPEMISWRYRVFAATWLGYVGYYFARKPFYIVKASLGDHLNFDATTLGHIGAAFLIAYAIGQFSAGYFGARFGARVVLLVGMSVSIVANIAFGFVDNPTTFMAFMFLNGLAQATGWSANVGTMASWFERHERGRVMGVWATNFQVGGVAANALASAVLHAYGFRQAFFAGSGVLLLIMLVNVFWQRNRPEDVGLPALEDDASAEDVAAGGVLPPGALTNIMLVGVAYFFMKFIRYALWSWAPYFLKKNFHLDEGTAGYVATLFDLSGIPGVMLIGWISDRFFKSRRAEVSLLMLALLTVACVILVTIGVNSLWGFVLSLVLIGVTLYGPDALLTGAGAMDIGSRRAAALAAGVISGMGSMGSVVQELLIGKMYDENSGNLGPIFAMILGAAGASMLVIGFVVYRNRSGTSDV